MTIRSIRTCLAFSLLAACGGDDVNHLADAPPSGGSDAPADAPTVGIATLTVTLDGVPVPNVVVHFQNADGSLISTKATDANGDASETVHIGAIVTDIDPTAPPPGFGLPTLVDRLHTWVGVKPNDHLRLDLGTRGGINQAGVTVTIPDDGQPHYELSTSCGSSVDISPPSGGSAFASNPPVSTTLQLCSDKQDIVVIAQNAGFTAVDAFIATDITVADDKNIDLSAATFAAVDQINYNYTNIPAGVASNINVVASLVTAKGQIYFQSGSASVDGATATVPFAMPASQALAVTVSAVGQETGDQSIVDWGPQGDVDVDVTASLLKAITDVAAYDVAAHTTTWTEDATGLSADFVRTRIQANRSTDTAFRVWNWELAAPHGATGAVTFPVIPVGTFDFNVAAEDGVNVADLRIGKVPNGYDSVRALIMSSDAPASVAVGATGHAVVEQFGRQTFRGKALSRARAAAKRAKH